MVLVGTVLINRCFSSWLLGLLSIFNIFYISMKIKTGDKRRVSTTINSNKRRLYSISIYFVFKILFHPFIFCLNCKSVCAILCSVPQWCLTLCDPMDCSPPGSSVHADSPGKNAGVGCHALLQGIVQTQGLNPGPQHCKQILYHLSHQESPRACKLPEVTLILVISVCHSILTPKLWITVTIAY